MSIAHADGSGTGDIKSMPASGPPGIAAMVSVDPAPMVRVFWATEVAVNCVLADSDPFRACGNV